MGPGGEAILRLYKLFIMHVANDPHACRNLDKQSRTNLTKCMWEEDMTLYPKILDMDHVKKH